MADLQIPATTLAAIATPLLGVVAAAGKMLWSALQTCQTQCRADMQAAEQRATAERAKLEEQLQAWQRKWADEVKERSRESELFTRALRKLRAGSSSPPPSS